MKKLSKSQIMTAKTFGFMWKNSKTYKKPSKNIVKLHINDHLRRTDNQIIKIIKKYFKNKNKVNFLDAGCGLGYGFKMMFSEYVKKINYTGIDVHNNLNDTKKFLSPIFLRSNSKLDLFKISMNKIPKKNFYKKFDFIWAEGTIHHSENISSAIQNLSNCLKKNGIFIFWTINEQKPLRKITDKYFRNFYSELSLENQFKESKLLADLSIKIGKILGSKKVKIDKEIKSLDLKKGNYKIQNLIYDFILKLYYYPKINVNRVSHQIFDWYSPVFYHQISNKNLKIILKINNLKILRHYERSNGHYIISKKIK